MRASRVTGAVYARWLRTTRVPAAWMSAAGSPARDRRREGAGRVEPRVRRHAAPDPLVERLRRRAELQHIAQHGAARAARFDRAQERERLRHGGRVRVVAVVEHRDASGAHQLQPVRRRRERGQRRRRLAPRHAEVVAHQNGREGVPHVVPPEERQHEGRPVGKREAGASVGAHRDVGRAKVGLHVLERVGADLRRPAPVSRPEARVVGVHHQEPLRAERGDRFRQLALRVGDGVERAEPLQMRLGHDREDAHLGTADRGQLGDLPGRPHGELQDEHLVVRTKPRQGQGKPDLVVLVPHVLQHPPARPEHGRDHLLRRRLAVRSRHGDAGDARRVAAVARERLERRERIGDRDHGASGARGRVGERPVAPRQAPRRARFERRGDEVVPVRALARERHEEDAGRNGAAVDGGLRERNVRARPARHEPAVGHGEHVGEREPGIRRHAAYPRAFSAFAATARSSNSIVRSPRI